MHQLKDILVLYDNICLLRVVFVCYYFRGCLLSEKYFWLILSTSTITGQISLQSRLFYKSITVIVN